MLTHKTWDTITASARDNDLNRLKVTRPLRPVASDDQERDPASDCNAGAPHGAAGVAEVHAAERDVVPALSPKPQRADADPVLQHYVWLYREDIAAILAQVPRALLLLLKTNDCLRAVDYALGSPVPQFAVMAAFAQRGIAEYSHYYFFYF